ncbi:hypothetical protein N657DRAFT_465152 [Parathielavia appendiculata]|uniref:Uncharacterized protein n=1 Tax=Parathielavia appendiculata TaxID=2587402 RepID=A0AAN6TP33_9PEZI|nr:hypothetical protein N657DRAFT_465152 [Parathielavia appendiculata]
MGERCHELCVVGQRLRARIDYVSPGAPFGAITFASITLEARLVPFNNNTHKHYSTASATWPWRKGGWKKCEGALPPKYS